MYLVRIGSFVDEFTQTVSQQVQGVEGLSSDAVLDEFKKALSEAQNRHEVAVTDEAWTNYLVRNNISYSAVQQTSHGGRNELPSWHHLLPIFAGYMLTHCTGPDRPDNEAIANAIHEAAQKKGIMRLPTNATIRDVVGRTFLPENFSGPNPQK